MKIITISREFGSGGRELGKRLADCLGIAYYDTEIITEIAKQTNLDENYVSTISEKGVPSFNFHFGHTFGAAINQTAMDVVVAQHKVIKELAKKGDCVIVGRCADKILQDYKPLRIFVYADMESKIKRCREKNSADNGLDDKQLAKKIKSIDNGRKKMYEFISGGEWGEMKQYDLCINTTVVSIKEITPCVYEYANVWFKCKKDT